MEKVNIRRLRSQAKILGTLVTVGGAMMMTLIKGPLLNLPWTKENSNPHSYSSLGNKQEPVKAAIVISISSICSSAFTILLVQTPLVCQFLSITVLLKVSNGMGATGSRSQFSSDVIVNFYFKSSFETFIKEFIKKSS